jgi:GT2 family glycosyltransferase
VEEHEHKQNYAVSGMGHWHFIYSYEFYEKWSGFQEELLQEKWKDPFIRKRLQSVMDPHLLLEEEIIHEIYTPFILHPRLKFITMFEEIFSQHGPMLDDFHLPWLTFCTGNVSMPKHCLTALGGFDEQFFPLGYDDWELGYRFYLEGGKFCCSRNAEAYQQMTPANPNREHIADQNYQKFYKKHPDFAVLLLALHLRLAVPYTVLSKIVAQHKSLKNLGERYLQLSESFEYMLQLLAAGHTPPFKHSQILKCIVSNRGVLSDDYTRMIDHPKMKDWSVVFTKMLY